MNIRSVCFITIKRLFTFSVLACVALFGVASADLDNADQGIEIRLTSHLDDERGFCIDILGPKKRASVDSGLQAHTCYSYQGEIGIDQAFDEKLVSENTFYISGFDVCMTASAVALGATLGLQACENVAEQKFDFQTDGSIRLVDDTSLCLTVSSSDSIQGGGGTPPHLKRPISMENCDQALAEFQTWSL